MAFAHGDIALFDGTGAVPVTSWPGAAIGDASAEVRSAGTSGSTALHSFHNADSMKSKSRTRGEFGVELAD